jgi:hypothetical protein
MLPLRGSAGLSPAFQFSALWAAPYVSMFNWNCGAECCHRDLWLPFFDMGLKSTIL